MLLGDESKMKQLGRAEDESRPGGETKAWGSGGILETGAYKVYKLHS